MDHVYSIYEITGIIKNLFEQHFSSLRIAGEISNCRPSSTGHLYFTLKDDKAALQAVMFKGRTWTLGFEPKDGIKVTVSGSLSVYEQRGSYQIIVESMERAGEGEILKLLEERKQKLAREGLFDQARKRPLPFFPLRIVVITSPTGAAVRDILTVLSRRNRAVSVTVLPAPVQGAEAAPALTGCIELANRHKLADVIIIGRGGGSLEDLLPFSDEYLVRAVAASEIPVISAVGHEIDWALTDFAADVRAPTPSAAAELAVPVLEDITGTISRLRHDMLHSISTKAEKIRLTINTFTPESLEMKFRRIEQPLLMRLDDAKEALLHTMQMRLTGTRHRLALLTQHIEGANPQELLNRGYAIVYDKDTGTVIRSAEGMTAGRSIRIRLARGELTAETCTADLR
ncbi:MAG: exodeoxyribonuclease VII large subunit [Treponema sp.]